MKVKLIKDTPINEKISICKGQIFEVRPILLTKFFGPIQKGYQIINDNCQFMGEFLPVEHCLEQPEEQTYTEKEWNDMENYYLSLLDKEREKKKNCHKLIDGLTEQINQKNREIEKQNFFVEALSLSLELGCAEIKKLREQRKAQNG